MPTDLRARLASDLDASFEELVRGHQHLVYGAALRMSAGSRADAEEVAQEAFVRAYKALRRYPPERIQALQLRPWLARITLNLCRNAARDRTRRPQTTELVEPPSHADATDAVCWDALLAGLPDRYRAPVVLRYVEHMPYSEIATALGRPVGTVKAQVHRGLALLADAAGLETP